MQERSALLPGAWDNLRAKLAPHARIIGSLGALVLAAVLIATTNDYVVAVSTTIVMYTILGLGLNIVVGWAGLLDLGYSAFFAIGAYTSAILTTYFGVDFWLSLVAAAFMAGVAGIVIGYPTLRLHSDYLAIVTLGFGEIVRTSFNNWDYVNGPDGIWDVPPPSIFGYELQGQAAFLVLAVVFAIAVWFFASNLGTSRIARGWRAIREDEACAAAIGIPALRLKLAAYVCGGLCGGVAGAFFASRIGLISPMSFTYLLSFLVLNLVIIGGLGSLPGIILGAIVVIGIPEGLRGIEQYRLLGFSISLVVLVLIRPNGLWPERERLQPADDRDAMLPSIAAADETPETQRQSGDLLVVRNLSKRYGGIVAASDVSFAVRRGEIFSLIGPNGAGKTTVLNCVSGVVRASSGSVVLGEVEIGNRPPHMVAAAGLARTFQGVRLFKQLSVIENVLAGCYGWQRSSLVQCALGFPSVAADDKAARAMARACCRFVGVADLERRRASELSYADQRRVELARALAAKPKMLLLDEPAAGMNPTEKAELGALLVRIGASGYTILIIEHDMALVMSISDRVAVMDQGRLIALGRPEEIQRDPHVIAAYLGREDDLAEADGGAGGAVQC